VTRLRVLIFSASFGAGHVRAAEALIEALKNREPEADIDHVDFGVFLSRTFNTMLKSTYIEMIKHTPKLWGKFYYRTAKIPPHSVFQRFLNGLGRRKLMNYIHGLQPDLVICTYPTVGGALGVLRQQGELKAPVVTAITDYAIHSQWINPGVDMYIVGCEDVRIGLLRRGIDEEKIKVTGIPVSPRFERVLDRENIAARLGIDPQCLTLLIMSGAYGVLDSAKWLLKLLDDIPGDLQVLIVCGKDERLYHSLDGVIEQARHPVRRFGFIYNVEEFMAVSDIIITKAGGLTVSEALTRRLPILIYKPIPGQEEENALFLQNIGAGKTALNDEELGAALKQMITDPDTLAQMREAAAWALPGKAADQAIGHMLALLKKKGKEQRTG
jgi:processive 1,2-diacylglycerol beta-glucosyltransferase